MMKKSHDKDMHVPPMEKYQCDCIRINCATYVIKGENGREVKARPKSVALKEFKPNDLFVAGAML